MYCFWQNTPTICLPYSSESILYPFVPFYDTPKELLLNDEGFVDILMHAQSTGITTAL